jgi:hypothetical protein
MSSEGKKKFLKPEILGSTYEGFSIDHVGIHFSEVELSVKLKRDEMLRLHGVQRF